MEHTSDTQNRAISLARGSGDRTTRTPSPQPPRRSLVQGDPRITCFNGDGTQNAREWLQQFERAMSLNGVDQPTEPYAWLEEFSMLLEGEAAYWANADPVVGKIIFDSGMLRTSQREVITVKDRFLDRFRRPQEVQRNPITDIQFMIQGQSESLHHYYQRALQLLETAGSNDGEGQLDHTQASVLDLTIRNYINGIRDITLRWRMFTYATKSRQSLHGAFLKAEAEAKQIRAGKEELDPTKAEAEKDLRRKMGEYIHIGQTVPQDLIYQWKELTKAEMLPPIYPQARLTVEPLSRGPKVHDATLLNPLCRKCGTLGHKTPDCASVPMTQDELLYLDELISRDIVRMREEEERRESTYGKGAERQMQSDGAWSKGPNCTSILLTQAERSDLKEVLSRDIVRTREERERKQSAYAQGAEHQTQSAGAWSKGLDYTTVPLTLAERLYVDGLVTRDVVCLQEEEERRQSAYREGIEQQTQSTGAWSKGPTAAHATPKDSCSLVEGTSNEHTPNPDSAILPNSILPLPQQATVSIGNSSHLASSSRSHRFRILTDGSRYIVKHRGVIKFKGGPGKEKALLHINTMLNRRPIEMDNNESVPPITHLDQLSPHSRNELKRLFTLPELKKEPRGKCGEGPLAPEPQVVPESLSKPPETVSFNPDISIGTLSRQSRVSIDLPCSLGTHKTATAKKTAATSSSSKSVRAVRDNTQLVNTVGSHSDESDDDWESDDENSEGDFQ
ncbi:hypothetical protein JMJ35_006646 [Cladonia borealis]|uniref:CCHC-type domain-containing protein n=1 Tax=Cladonia borealis TaxID=184061 RepID=A0AA39V4C5_9LECA|nr:hypothetical protein JMJ35_006646 [Cladonia borealis]